MKNHVIKLLIVAPIIGIFCFWLNEHLNNKKISSRQNVPRSSKLPSNSIEMNSVLQQGDAQSRTELENARMERLNELTMKRYDLATQASGLKASDFGRNGDFLMKKHQELFDTWGLDKNTRDEFVKTLVEQSVRLADISLKSSTSWPANVGHAANRKSNAEHAKKQLGEVQKVQSETRNKLIALVGVDRVVEFEHRKAGKVAGNDD